MTGSVATEGPVWNLVRRPSSGNLVWASDSATVKFLCHVDVKEFVTDPAEHQQIDDYADMYQRRRAQDDQFTYSLMVVTTCVVMTVVTVCLPWLIIGST